MKLYLEGLIDNANQNALLISNSHLQSRKQILKCDADQKTILDRGLWKNSAFPEHNSAFVFHL